MVDKNGRAMASDGMVRYAVVGLGHIAQVAVLPAFRHAAENSRLAALVSDDPTKLKMLAKKYGGAKTYSYDQYEECLRSGEVDAVYICLPNHLHCQYTVRAASAGVHVLCEKPMAVTQEECEEMMQAVHENDVKLMIAYRLHFEEANLEAIRIARSGEIGELRSFDSVFSQQVAAPNIRLDNEKGGGPVYDMGVYCINAARYLFQDEPEEVMAMSANNGDERFRGIDEMTSVILRFPGERLATFTTSFGMGEVSSYRLTGTRGDLRMQPAYDYQTRLTHYLTIDGKTRKHVFAKRDHFAPELVYFSRAILEDFTPEPSGEEGLADVRIVEAIYQSARIGERVKLEPFARHRRPGMEQEIHKPPVAPPSIVHARSPSGD